MGKLKGVGDVFVDEGTGVAKIGRTTGRTEGRVTAFEIDNVTVRFDIGDLFFPTTRSRSRAKAMAHSATAATAAR